MNAPDDLADIEAALEPTIQCEVCKTRIATSFYPDKDDPQRVATCGRFECEITVQYALDYHNDRG